MQVLRLTCKILSDSWQFQNWFNTGGLQNPVYVDISNPGKRISTTHGSQTYVVLPMPDSSKTLGLPIVPAESITSFLTENVLTSPSDVLYSTPLACNELEVDELSQRILVAKTPVRTTKFFRSAKGV